MKTCAILLIITFLCVIGRQAQAQVAPYKITITFFSEKGERFWVVINGIRQNEQASQNVKIPDLIGNTWKAQVVFENQNLPEVGKSIHIPTAPTQDAQLVYQIKRNRKGVHQVRLFSSTGFPNQMIEIIRGQGGEFRLPKIPFPQIPNFPIEVSNPTQFPRPHTNPNNNPNNRPPNHPTQHPCHIVMDERTFDALKDNIEVQQFEETKQNTAKQAIAYYCVSASQVRKLLSLFSFEQTKLEFAKWVYDYTYDKENFYRLNDAFDFSMSVDELQAYINSKR